MVTKTDFDTRLKSLSKRITSNKTKHLFLEKELKKNKFDASYFRGKEYFGTDGLQNFLVFQPMFMYLKEIGGSGKISGFRPKGIYNEVTKPPNNPLAPEKGPVGTNMHLKFDGSCLKTTEKYYFYPKLTELNIYIVYELSSNLNNFDLPLENCLFGAVRLTKNADIDNYKYLVYGTGFDSRGTFLFPDGSFAQNVIILE